uniref:Uncharacterized protein n=1 Tax=Amphimedon queenslandica TaxID=400682 RepID=A0A1X7TCJ9_AMPQE
LHQRDIYNFGDKDYSLPPSCLISVYSSPDAVPTLHYSVPVEGVADPVTLNIHRSRRTAHPIAAAAPSSSGNDETKPVPTKRRREGGFDIKTAKQKIKQVMIENHSDFAEILESSLKEIASKLFGAKIITRQVQKSPTYDAIASSFVSMINILNSKSDLEKHCVTFLEALSSVGGPIERVAECLREKWTTALEGALQLERSVKRQQKAKGPRLVEPRSAIVITGDRFIFHFWSIILRLKHQPVDASIWSYTVILTSQRDSSDDEDEVVKELMKAQNELKAVHEYNQQQKRMLHSLAKSEIRRQEIRKQLQETDQEVMEWLRVFSVSI